jgi:S1-C subfamily serine protease
MIKLFSKLAIGLLLAICLFSYVSADVLMLFGDVKLEDKQFTDRAIGYGNYFCVKNENNGSYIVTAGHVVEMVEKIKEDFNLTNEEFYVLLYNKGDNRYYRYPAKIIAIDKLNDIGVLFVKDQKFKVDQVVDDAIYPIGTKVCIAYDSFGLCNNIIIKGLMISNDGTYNGRNIRLIDIDVVRGCSGSAVRLNDENGPVLGILTDKHEDNGLTIITPSSIVIDFLKKNKIF